MADASQPPYGPPEASPEARRRLARLGLTWDLLWQAIAAGQEARNTVTEYEPLPAAGLVDWIARVGALRRQLAQLEWKPVNNHHIPVVVNPERTVGVGVLLGDEHTGWPEPSRPRSKYPKGPQVLQLGETNDALFSLTEVGSDLLDPQELARLQTWMLVTHRFLRPGQLLGQGDEVHVYSELSLPGKPSSTHIDTWLKRILLPLSRFPPPPRPLPEDGEDMDGLTDGM